MSEINIGTPPRLQDLADATVLDGLTGEPIRTIVDGTEAEVRFADPQQPLIEVSTEELIHELAKATDAVKAAKRAKKAAGVHLKDCQERLSDIADALCERDQPQQSELALGEAVDS